MAFAAILSAGLIYSCNNSTDTTTSTDSTTMTTDSGMTSSGTTMSSDTAGASASTAPLEKMDRDFVVKDAGGGKANDELTSFASRRGLTLNTDSLMNLHKSHIESLRNKKGAAFDKAYMSMMVNDHKKDVNEFEKASKMCKDQECLAWAGKTLPTLQMHLDSAQAINKSL